MKTGNTDELIGLAVARGWPQWSPVMKTGNTRHGSGQTIVNDPPQWSPVMKTGNTRHRRPDRPQPQDASMEPGHEDREYPESIGVALRDGHASMEPGHEDREYMPTHRNRAMFWRCLNGARS